MDSDTQVVPLSQRSDQSRRLPIDGQCFKQLTEAALNWLKTNQQIVNALNVFPVPDGDTGTNMVLTMQAAFDEIANSPERNAGKMVHSIAHGALMGARGNSGVILSQLWRGFARALDNQEIMDGIGLVKAFKAGRDTAYKGVVRPVEGTILTVAKDVADAAEEALQMTQDPYEILSYVVQAADKSVQRTPELLPVLKEAGVVDAGGKGLFYIYEGMTRYFKGQPLDVSTAMVQPLSAMNLEKTLEIIEPGQDFEVVVDFQPREPIELEGFYNKLEQMGTSIQVGEGDGMYRFHIHVPTENLQAPIDYARSLGTMIKASVENLMVQVAETEQKVEINKLSLAPIEPGQIGVIAVAPGPGIARVFASLRVAGIVEGGQTMNPSAQEIIKAIESLPTDKIILLPNNKNIILTAGSAVEIIQEKNKNLVSSAQSAEQQPLKKIAVVPSQSVPQGLVALLRLAPDGDFEDVVNEMTAAMKEVETGEITTATRSVKINGVQVHEGRIIALLDDELILEAPTVEKACLGLLKRAGTQEKELITMFYGSDLKTEAAEHIAELIRRRYPNVEVEVHNGGQPHYPLILSIE